ncbi:MAG: filamentous hemagglutinin, partial [Rubrivivax sp.]
GAIDTHATSSDTAAATTIESRNGGALLKGGAGATLRGVAIDVVQNATVRGATVSVTGAIDLHTTTDTHEEKNSNYGSVLTRSAQGVDMHLTDTDARGQTSLARSTIKAANVDIRAVDENGQRGELTLSGTTVRTPGTLTLEASRLIAPVQLTQADTSHTSEGRDLMWQRAQGEGGSDPTANYAQVYAGKIVTNVDGATIETGAKDSIDALARQPGMAWVDQLRNDPALAGKVDWQRVDDAYKGWDYKKEGLTPEGAGIVTLVVAYFTAGAASSLSGTVGAAAGGGMTGAAVGGAVAAGFTTLASQAAVAIINNQGNLGHALRDLGSSQSVKGLLAAIATGGALGAMNMNPTGLPTAEGGAQGFMTQLGQNLQAGLA